MVWCPWRGGIGQMRVAGGRKLELFVHRHKWDAASQVLSIPTVDYLENAQRRCSWQIVSSKIRVKWKWEDEETVQTADLIIIPKVLAGSETSGCLFNAMFTHENSKLVYDWCARQLFSSAPHRPTLTHVFRHASVHIECGDAKCAQGWRSEAT